MKLLVIASVAVVASAGNANAQEGRPLRPDARCLSSIVVSQGASLDVLSPQSVSEATVQYERYWQLTTSLGAAEDEVVTKVTEALRAVKKLEDDGTSLPGSAEVQRENFLSQVEETPSAVTRQRSRFPLCQWPDTNSASVRERIVAIKLD